MDIERNERTLVCSHCGNRTPHTIVGKHRRVLERSDEFYEQFDPDDLDVLDLGPPDVIEYVMTVCGTCRNLALFSGLVDYEEDPECFWPDWDQLGVGVPQEVQQAYREATRVRNISPRSFAVEIRRALEAICAEQGIASGKLDKQLQKLFEKTAMPANLKQVADALRVLGNMAAHFGQSPTSPAEVITIDEFFRAVIEYVYVAPAKLASYRTKLDALINTNKIKDHDLP
ncbi:MAG: DUF4145 domain-containing protein [Fimbriimonadaceae bacterium]|nr:MAG: hypothetical protein UZ18_ATM001000966 [Armatimonadetes bacterium OLB18]WKZ80134.1 MAG: DUF4145 domain-containing protein [Fimbriimonadaceae bacterium]